MRCWPVLLISLLAACSDSTSASADAGASSRDAESGDARAEDAGALDATTPADAAALDAVAGEDATSLEDASTPDAGEPDAGEAVFTLTSAAFTEGSAIPARHACSGQDLQPQLSWTGAPAGTMSFALVLIDDTIDFTHWVAFDIPLATTSLPEGASDNQQLPSGTNEADAYCRRYCGPCPPNMHTYTFRIYALDVATINFTRSGAFGNAELQASFGSHQLGLATLTGTFTP